MTQNDLGLEKKYPLTFRWMKEVIEGVHGVKEAHEHFVKSMRIGQPKPKL